MKAPGAFDWAGARARVERLREALEQAAGGSAAERERVFRERAERLARPAARSGVASPNDAVIVFRSGAERYALPLSSLAEAIPNPLCAAVPGAPEQFAGVIQVRGEIRPVLDLARLLGIPPRQAPGPNHVLLVRAAGREFGVRVDEVEDIRVLTEQERGPAPSGATRVMCMTPDRIGVLDPDRLFEGDVR
jgi:purine-binding chemotaxis protein CheW